MRQTIQRKRFFLSPSTDSDLSLPTTEVGRARVRLTPTRSKSLASEDKSFRLKASTRSHRLSMPTINTSNNDYSGYTIPHRNNKGKVHNPGLTVASVTGCLVLALLGALVFQRQANLDLMLEVKQEIVHHLHRLQEVKEYPSLSQGAVSMHGELDNDKHLNYLERQHFRTKKSIQLLSKRLLREKYGPGPKYYVEMQLVFDPESSVYDQEEDRKAATVVIETARIEHMPHSIFHFLELVSHQVYDGTSFHRRANHIVQAGPSVTTGSYQPKAVDPSLSTIMFQEYSSEMTHTPYTLGFPGRPGGPDFYINMKDNSKLHGPGGQSRHYGDALGNADPCFGSVVKGFDVIDKIYQSDVIQTGHKNVIVHPIIIKKMTIPVGEHNISPLTNTSPLRRRT